MRFAPRPTASAVAASSALTLSGPRASGVTTGTLPRSSAATTSAGHDGTGSADEPELVHLLRLEADLVAGERKRVGADRGADVGVDRGEALAHDLERLRAS